MQSSKHEKTCLNKKKTEYSTCVISIDFENPQLDMMDKAGKILRNGGLVAFPTETVYGLGANALDETGVRRIFEAKGRPLDNPLILHVSSPSDVETFAKDIPDIAYQLMARFWPGPLTLILPRRSVVPDIVSGGLQTVAVRMPDHTIALLLIEKAGVPIAAPSANISGRPSPTSAEHVISDLYGKVDMIIDGGVTGIGVESTVLDILSDPPVILRPGGVSVEELRDLLPNVTVIDNDKVEKPRSPGMKYRHYSPEAEVIIISGEADKVRCRINKMASEYSKAGKKVGGMVTSKLANGLHVDILKIMGNPNDYSQIAASLYRLLREFDVDGVDVVLAEAVSNEGLGFAVMNRLYRAAGGRIIKV